MIITLAFLYRGAVPSVDYSGRARVILLIGIVARMYMYNEN